VQSRREVVAILLAGVGAILLTSVGASFLTSVGATIRRDCSTSARHYSRRTEDAYVHWIRRFIVFHGLRHPRELRSAEIAAFITWLAVDQPTASRVYPWRIRSDPPTRK
jgi:hypothetical protein